MKQMRDENPYCETQRTFGECEKSKEIVNPEEKCLSSHFIDLTRDYGFKIVMADEDHPELMLGLLNAVIQDREIVSIRFLNTELLPPEETAHRANYDVLCTDSKGNRFLTEMQANWYDCFPDRLMAYTGGQVSRLLKHGEQYTSMRKLYVISILGDYLKVRDEEHPQTDVLLRRAEVRMNDTGKSLMDRPSFIFLQLPAAKEPTKDSAFIEKWTWYIREMVNFKDKPSGLDGYFDLLFEASDRDNIEKGKLSIYDKMVRDEIQIAAERDYAVRTGREQGREEGHAAGLKEGREEGHAAGLEEGRVKANNETARKMKAAGIAEEIISQCTGLSVKEMESL